LGAEGLIVSALGLGCMGMSTAYGPADEREALRTIYRAFDLGVDHLDTADVYGAGTNEQLVGRALAGRRDEVIVATKFGNVVNPATPEVRGVDGRPENVRDSCEASLRRVGVEHIDLYYQHRVDPNIAVEETWGAMSELVTAGKVRYLGISEASAATIRRAHATHPVSALQSEYSLFTRDPEGAILDTVRELGVGFVAWGPLGRGLLTGTVTDRDALAPDDTRHIHPRFDHENLPRNLDLVHQIEAVAEGRGATSAQVALAWLLSRGDDIVVIPGAKSRVHLEENIAALDVELNGDHCALLERIAPPGAVAGERFPASLMHRQNV
jgi:aryl-alcohol dehydrogenase-like predicted oxidoreductase